MKSLAFALLVSTGFSAAAFAQDQPPPAPPPSPFMQACGQDMQTYCASAQTREDRRSCVMANKDKFSASCKSFMDSHPMHQHSQQQQPMQGQPNGNMQGPGGNQPGGPGQQ